jgi:septum formation protein
VIESTPPPPIVLASTSPYRRALLERLGVPFTCADPGVDEDALKASGLAPIALAEALAVAKARAVADRHPGALVIGGDQLAELDGRVLGKPGGRVTAIAQLSDLAGKTHRLITALAVVRGRWQESHTDVAVLAMRDLDPAAIGRYVDADRPFDCAGSYKLEARGIALFRAITCADHSAITGLPLIALTTLLRSQGVPIP